MKKVFTCAMVVFSLALPLAGLGQKIGERSTTSRSGVRRAAVLTTFFRNNEPSNNKKAMDSVSDELDRVLTKFGIEEVNPAEVNAAWQKATGKTFDDRDSAMPRPEDLVALGKQLGVDYVIFSRCKWHVKSVWVGLGPKTKADAVEDLWVVNPANSEYVSKMEDVKADDNAKDQALGIALDVFVAPVTFVSGGPETPHMQRAGQVAMIKALQPWVQNLKGSDNKIGR